MTGYLLLLCHLIGDYVLQSHVMATRKTSSWLWALVHAAFYSLPFAALLLWLDAPNALPILAIIGGTHAVIDRYRIAAKWCAWYGVGHPGIWTPREGFESPPPFLGVWLTIIVDNTLHLAINGAAFVLLASASL